MTERPPVDWERIEREYRAGQLSVSEIARQHGVSRPLIYKRAKAEAWTQNLAGRVREEITSRLVTDAVTPRVTPVNAREAIETAAARGVEVVRQHRRILGETFALVQQLLTGPRGDDRKAEAAIVRDLGTALKSLIPLERQAFNLDGGSPPVDPGGNTTLPERWRDMSNIELARAMLVAVTEQQNSQQSDP